jgi:multidrug resistance efflux pump
VRQEEVDVAARAVDKATADLTLAEEQFRRTSAVTGAGYSSKQNLDNAQAACRRAGEPGADAVEFAAAQHGPTAEDRASADGQWLRPKPRWRSWSGGRKTATGRPSTAS